MSADLHVVFGAGQVGPHLVARLRTMGHRVRVVKRSPRGVPSGAEAVLGDATDAAFCMEAVRGARIVYHCMNPAEYSAKAWQALVPVYMDNLIAAAGRNDATLVVLDNLYMLGRTGGRPMNEETPIDPCSKKGEIRAEAVRRLFSAHRAGDVRAVSGRASDYYGPGGANTYMGDLFWKPAIAGKTVRVVNDPDAIHTYHYIPDVAAGLAALGTAGDDVLGSAWMLPCAPAESMRTLAHRFSETLGHPIRMRKMPRLAIKSLGLFVPILREIDEMLYQWDEPFTVDDRRFRARFSVEPVPAGEAARATVVWAKTAYGAGCDRSSARARPSGGG